jgi:hypothetical protein
MDARFPTDTFVDVTYRGIEVGRRAKLTEVAPDAGYVEVAAPMPVGSTVVLATDDGIAITAEVRGVHEQVGGSDKAPGMQVAPVLEGAAVAWWAQRVTVAAAPPPDRRTRELSAAASAAAQAVAERDRADSGAPAPGVRRTRALADGEIKAALTAAMAEEQRLGIVPPSDRTPVDGVPVQVGAVDSDGLVDDGKKTEIMSSVDPELIAKLMGGTGSGTEPPIVDDGKRTVAMDAVAVPEDDANGDDDGEDGDGEDDGNGNGDGDGVVIEEQKPTPSGRMPAVKVKRGKRRKRR